MKLTFLLGSFLLGTAALAASDAVAPPVHEKHFRAATVAAQPLAVAPDVAIVNSASFLPGVSPGALATIFGHDLTHVSGVVVAGSNPFPTVLANVSVLISGIYAPIYTIAYANGEDQISVQVPYNTPTGANAVRVQVFDNGAPVADIRADSYDEDPGIFVWSGNYALAQHYPDYNLIGPGNLASPGDILVLYTTGLGPLSQKLTDGYGAPSNPPASTVDPFQVKVAGVDCRIFYSGLTPGFVGLYQINLQLPGNLPAGDLSMQILSPYANSQTVLLPVR